MQSAAIVLLLAAGCALTSAAIKPLPVTTRWAEVAPAEAFADDDGVSHRLPNNTRPLSYDVQLTTNVHTQTDFNFTGTVAITIEALAAASRNITLHHRQLNILSAQLIHVNASNAIVPLAEHVYTVANQFLVYPLAAGAADLLPGNQYVLTIQFSGVLREDEAGFYRSSYLDDAGQRRWLATTQFEQTDARHAFPCFDEPALRAKFTIRITHGRQYHAISNMPAVGSPVVNGDLATTTFDETPLTPTYLIAFIVSDFAAKSATNANGFVQRVFARSNAIDTADFALDTGIKSLDAFEAYFGIKFALPKMDQVAVPDFAAGAMENWGLVTYREPYLLFNESRSTFVNRRNIATVIAHEYAHQWFGNLVTPKWWTYIWLNEGFATLFENYATDWVFPHWKILDAFVFATLQGVMGPDSTNRTRPMTHYVDHHDAVSRLFDNIAYAKSGTVLRMFLNAFTEASFKKALISYLNLKTNSDAVEEDLFAAIEAAVKADRTLDASLSVATIMSSWTRQSGYPIIHATRDYSGNSVSLHQERYFSEPQSVVTPATWWIPYNFATGAAERTQFAATAATNWLSTASAAVNVTGLRTGDWLLLNKQQTGYYRVQYDEQNYKLLAEALKANHSDIYLTNRAQLIDDAFELARTGRQSYAIAFDLTKYLAEEVEYVPWASTFSRLNLVDRLYSGSAKFGKFELYIRQQVKKLFATVTLEAPAEEEHHYRKQARVQAIGWACEYGLEECWQQTGEAFRGYLAGSRAIHQDSRAAVLCSGVRNATDEQYVQVMQLLQQETDADQRIRLIDALACASKPEQLKSYVETSTGVEHRWTSQGERYRVFVQVVSRRPGTLVAIEFLAKNLGEAERAYGKGNLNAAFDRVADQVNSAERKTKFNELLTAARLEKEIVPDATLVRIEQIVAGNDAWIAANQKVIEDWVDANGASSVVVSTMLLVILAIVTQFF